MLAETKSYVAWNVWCNICVLSMFMIYGCNVCTCKLICCIAEENKSLTATGDNKSLIVEDMWILHDLKLEYWQKFCCESIAGCINFFILSLIFAWIALSGFRFTGMPFFLPRCVNLAGHLCVVSFDYACVRRVRKVVASMVVKIIAPPEKMFLITNGPS